MNDADDVVQYWQYEVLLDLPCGFDVIAGLDWMTTYNVKPQVKERSIVLDDKTGKTMVVAGCGAISAGMPNRSAVAKLYKEHSMCYLHPKGGKHGLEDADASHIEILETKRWKDAYDYQERLALKDDANEANTAYTLTHLSLDALESLKKDLAARPHELRIRKEDVRKQGLHSKTKTLTGNGYRRNTVRGVTQHFHHGRMADGKFPTQ